MGIYALWLFTRLEGSVDEILRDNYQFVLAGQAMKESAEGMDSALSLALAGEEERGSKLFQRYTPVFEEHLRHQRGNISVPGDGRSKRQDYPGWTALPRLGEEVLEYFRYRFKTIDVPFRVVAAVF